MTLDLAGRCEFIIDRPDGIFEGRGGFRLDDQVVAKDVIQPCKRRGGRSNGQYTAIHHKVCQFAFQCVHGIGEDLFGSGLVEQSSQTVIWRIKQAAAIG